MKISNCCGALFYEPGWPDSDICSACREHADAVEEEGPPITAIKTPSEHDEANRRATNKVSVETAKEIVHRMKGNNNV